MSEKVLFELLVKTDDTGHTQVTINTSPEWDAYHQSRHADRRGCGPLKWLFGAHETGEAPPRQRVDHAEHLQQTLESLQTIYDDLYGDALA